MPAVRRHERRGEDLDAECRQARSDYNAAQYQRRKELAEEAPAVVAVLPAGLPVPPGPWEGWEIPTNQIGLQPAANVWSRVDGAPEGSIPVERVTTWTWGARMGLDPVGQVVQDWHDNAPGVGDRLNTLAPHERAALDTGAGGLQIAADGRGDLILAGDRLLAAGAEGITAIRHSAARRPMVRLAARTDRPSADRHTNPRWMGTATRERPPRSGAPDPSTVEGPQRRSG